jgi:Tfp pilus assembly protein PilO
MALRKINPLWAVLAAAVIGISAAALLHVRALSSRDEELAAISAQIERTAQANAQAEQIVREIPELRQAVRRFARQMPPDANLSLLIESVGENPATDGQPEREIVTKPTIAGALVARTPFSLRYRGSFRGTIAVLRRLQDGDLLTRVERIVLERAANEPRTPLRVQVDFSTFSRTSKELEKWAQAEQ